MIAVIDTETNWENQVMSLGIALADEHSWTLADTRYYVLTPEIEVGGMYDAVVDLARYVPCSRRDALKDATKCLKNAGVSRIFAYNAAFDKGHLPEFSNFSWYDIMKVAAYRQHNPAIPATAPCCSTGRLKSHYGVEPMTRLLTGDCSYRETHNALFDAVDELQILKCLGLSLSCYDCARI